MIVTNENKKEFIERTGNEAKFVAMSLVGNEPIAVEILRTIYKRIFEKAEEIVAPNANTSPINYMMGIIPYEVGVETAYAYSKVKGSGCFTPPEKRREPYTADDKITFQPQSMFSAEDCKTIIDNVFNTLTVEERFIFCLTYVYRIAPTEISKIVKTRLDTVEDRLFLARKKVVDNLIYLEGQGLTLLGMPPLAMFVYTIQYYLTNGSELTQEERAKLSSMLISYAPLNANITRGPAPNGSQGQMQGGPVPNGAQGQMQGGPVPNVAQGQMQGGPVPNGAPGQFQGGKGPNGGNNMGMTPGNQPGRNIVPGDGAMRGPVPPNTQQDSTQTKDKTAKKSFFKKPAGIITLSVIGAAILGVGGFFLYKLLNKGDEEGTTTEVAEATTTEKASETTELTEAPTTEDTETTTEVTTEYQPTEEEMLDSYLKDKLVPQYGIADITELKYQVPMNGDEGESIETDIQGILSVYSGDLDSNGAMDMLILRSELRTKDYNEDERTENYFVMDYYSVRDNEVKLIESMDYFSYYADSREYYLCYSNETRSANRVSDIQLIYCKNTDNRGFIVADICLGYLNSGSEIIAELYEIAPSGFIQRGVSSVRYESDDVVSARIVNGKAEATGDDIYKFLEEHNIGYSTDVNGISTLDGGEDILVISTGCDEIDFALDVKKTITDNTNIRTKLGIDKCAPGEKYSKPAWMSAYNSYFEQIPEEDREKATYEFVNIDDDNIPEIVCVPVDGQLKPSLITYDSASGKAVAIELEGDAAYLKNEGKLRTTRLNEDGRYESFYYNYSNGKLELKGQGGFALTENGYSDYTWSGGNVSEEEYGIFVGNVYGTSTEFGVGGMLLSYYEVLSYLSFR